LRGRRFRTEKQSEASISDQCRVYERLEQTLAKGDITRARQEIRALVGEVRVEADKREIRLYSAQGIEAILLRALSGAEISNVGSGGRI